MSARIGSRSIAAIYIFLKNIFFCGEDAIKEINCMGYTDLLRDLKFSCATHLINGC